MAGSLTKSSSTSDAVVEPCRKNSPSPDKSRQLPWERGELLFLFDGPDDLDDRVIELHQIWHLVLATGGEWRFDKPRLDDRDGDTFMLHVEPDAFEKRGHPRLACRICGRLRQSAKAGKARDGDEMSLASF